MHRPRRLLTLLTLVFVAANAALAAGKARHVLVVVWDGMRPDFVSAENTPNLRALADRGVWFENHHPAYVSSTEVNGATIATGAYPRRSHVIGNVEYRPALDPLKGVAMEDEATFRGQDALTHGRYLNVATVAEILRSKGVRTAVAGTKPVVYLLDRAEREAGSTSRLLVQGQSLPTQVAGEAGRELGAFPAVMGNKRDRDVWTASALTRVLWEDGVPPYSVLWLAEPDFCQHETGPGSSTSLASIRASDACLGAVEEDLRRRGLLDDTDILVVSDHGFSTVERSIDVAADLRAAGFNARRTFEKAPAPGDVVVVGLGGSVSLYVAGHDEAAVRRLVATLQGRDYAGVLFTRKGGGGTFPLSLVRADSPEAPDVLVAMRWFPGRSATGAPGLIVSDGARRPGQGNHASLCRTDMHNMLVAAGPDFGRGIVDTLPTGNIDLAPTTLWLLGVDIPKSMDGRVLSEALAGAAPPAGPVRFEREEAERGLGGATWRQYLRVSEVGGVRYFDEGNGALEPAGGARR